MEQEKELSYEEVQKELGKTLNFFGNLSKELIKRYNEFHRMCTEREERLEREIEWRLQALSHKKEKLYESFNQEHKKYEEDCSKVHRDIKFIVKQLNSVKKTLAQEQPTATQQAKADAKFDL